MAQAVEQHTSREWSLTDYHRYVRITLGCGINVALCEMERRIVSGQLLLIPNGGAVEIDRFDFLSNYTLQLDRDDRVKVVTQRPAAGLLPGGISTIKIDPSDPENPVRTGPGRVMDGYYTVTERPPHPPEPATKTKLWISAEAARMKKEGEIPDGITSFAKLLEKRMIEAKKTNKSLHPVGWRHIKNQLRAWGLWPPRIHNLNAFRAALATHFYASSHMRLCVPSSAARHGGVIGREVWTTISIQSAYSASRKPTAP